MNNYLISIVTPSFNHEFYISRFIESVLSQDYQNWELIIVDDCSEDKTFQIAQNYKDERIKVYKNDFNSGVNYTINKAFCLSSGQIITTIASDDELNDNALLKINEYFNLHKNIDFTSCNLMVIDENSLPSKAYPNSMLPELKEREKHEILHDMFFYGNQLYAPGMCFKRVVLEKILPQPFSSILYQDYITNIDALVYFNLGIIKDCLVKYRILNTSLSNSGDKTIALDNIENSSVLDTYLKFHDLSLLNKIFEKEILEFKIKPNMKNLPFFLGMMASKATNTQRQIWGFNKVKDFYNSNVKLLHDEYGFVFKDLIKLCSTISISNPHSTVKKKSLFSIILKKTFSISKKNDKHILTVLGMQIRLK